MHESVVIYERAGDGGWGAYVPDLPGLGVAGATLDETQTLLRDALALHIAGLREDGIAIPEPQAIAATLPVPA